MVSQTRPLVFLWKSPGADTHRLASGEKGDDGQFSEALYPFCYKNNCSWIALKLFSQVTPLKMLLGYLLVQASGLKVAQEIASALEALRR